LSALSAGRRSGANPLGEPGAVKRQVAARENYGRNLAGSCESRDALSADAEPVGHVVSSEQFR